MITQRIRNFFETRRPEGPCLVVDTGVVRENYLGFEKALPQARIFYAVKANPAPEILRLLASLGSCFDTASVAEIEMALEAGATPERISYGNTIKKERDIARAHALGVSLYAVDCVEEVEKIARAAPGARVFCRVLTDGEGAEWPLSRKFGCVPEMAVDVLRHARTLGQPLLKLLLPRLKKLLLPRKLLLKKRHRLKKLHLLKRQLLLPRLKPKRLLKLKLKHLLMRLKPKQRNKPFSLKAVSRAGRFIPAGFLFL